MGFTEAISYNLSNITNFNGRASRPEFWWWILAIWVVESSSRPGCVLGPRQRLPGLHRLGDLPDPDARHDRRRLPPPA